MGNKVARVLIGIVIAVAVIVGVYFILPGPMKNPLKSFLQSTFNSNYKEIITTMQEAKIKGHKTLTYDEIMRDKASNVAWTVEKIDVDDAGNGEYYVYLDGYKLELELENPLIDDKNKSYNRVHCRYYFRVKKDGTSLTVDKKEANNDKGILPEQIECENDMFHPDATQDHYYQDTIDTMCEGLE